MNDGSLADLVDQVTVKAVGPKSPNARYIGLEHIEESSGRLGLAGTAPASVSNSTNGVFEAGDILFGKLRPNLRKSVQVDFGGFCSTDLIIMRARAGVDPAFAAHVASSESVFRHAERNSIGTGMPRTSWRAVAQAPCKVPPLEEQRRIAEILDTIDETIQATERIILKLRASRTGLVRRTLKHAEEGMPIRLLSELVPTVEYGISAPLSFLGSVPVLRMGNLQSGSVDVSDLRFTNQEVSALPLLKVGDVLFNRTNSIKHVGKTAIWRGELPRATFASYLVRVAPSPELLPDYLNLWMNTPETQIAIRRWATTAIQQVNINPTNLRRCEIRVPPIDAQEQVVSSVAALDSRLTKEAAVLSKLTSTRAGLAAVLLSGRMRAVMA